MGLLGWMKRQFIEIIEWTDAGPSTLVWRFPHHDNEIKNGAKLIVRPGQVAILVHEGQMADVYRPGTYTLETQNMPVLASLKGWKYGFNSPFRSEAYFVNTRQHLDMKWGTLNPITMRDQDFGMVRLRAYGIYAVRVQQEHAEKFFEDVVGTDGHYTTQEIEGHLRGILVSAFTNALGQAKIPALDLAGNYDAIVDACHERMEQEFERYGLTLTKFLIQSISLPPEVEKAIDTRSSMGALGNMAQYTQYQTAKAIGDAGRSGGGGAGMAMAEMGAGLMMGQQMMNQMSQANAQMNQAPQQQQAQQQGPSVADRLKKLKALHEQGLIDDDAFASKRDAILAEL